MISEFNKDCLAEYSDEELIEDIDMNFTTLTPPPCTVSYLFPSLVAKAVLFKMLSDGVEAQKLVRTLASLKSGG